VEALKDSDKFVRPLVIHTLGNLDSEAEMVVPALVLRLSDDVVEVRLAAIEELGRFGPAAKAALPALRDLQGSDSSKMVREAAGNALKRIRPPK
jgi:HEAT repeat protein